jgi:hypothetical protein
MIVQIRVHTAVGILLVRGDVSVCVCVCVCVCVSHLSRNVALQEVNEPHRFLLLREIKVHTVSECHDVKTVGVRVVLQQQLF